MEWIQDGLHVITDKSFLLFLLKTQYPSFSGCELQLSNFSPAVASQTEPNHHLDFFQNCIWQIDSIDMTSKKVYRLENIGNNMTGIN
jgi:hypothetical protein